MKLDVILTTLNTPLKELIVLSVNTLPWLALKDVILADGAFGQKGLVCLLDLAYPEGLEDLREGLNEK